MDEIRSLVVQARENVHDYGLSLLSDAVYRGDVDAKTLERQSAKIARALDKALHEIEVLERMTTTETL